MHSEVSAEGAPELSQPDGEPMPSAWADDLAPLDLDADPEAVTAPARRRPSRRALASHRGAAADRAGGAGAPSRTAPGTRETERVLCDASSLPPSTRSGDTLALSSGSSSAEDSVDDDLTGTFTVSIQPPLGMLSDTGQAVVSDEGLDVRRLSARRLSRLDRASRRALFVALAAQHVVLGAELIQVQGRQERRLTTACALVLLVNRHVSSHRARPLVAEMFAAAPEALMEQVAVDRRLSRAVADHLPELASQMAPTSDRLLRQALASWLRQRSATPTQAVARLLRQAPTYDRHRGAAAPQARPDRCAALLVAALEVLIAQQTHAAGECAVAVARLVEGPAERSTHWGAVTTRLCERAAAGFSVT